MHIVINSKGQGKTIFTNRTIPLDENDIVFRRYDGRHYHTRECTMLADGWFYRLDYRPVPLYVARQERLLACACVTGGITNE